MFYCCRPNLYFLWGNKNNSSLHLLCFVCMVDETLRSILSLSFSLSLSFVSLLFNFSFFFSFLFFFFFIFFIFSSSTSFSSSFLIILFSLFFCSGLVFSLFYQFSQSLSHSNCVKLLKYIGLCVIYFLYSHIDPEAIIHTFLFSMITNSS